MKAIGTPERIIELTAESFGFSYDDIVGRSKKQELAIARHASVYLISQFFDDFKDTDIAHYVNRHRTTIIHSLKEYETCVERKEINLFDINDIIARFEDED